MVKEQTATNNTVQILSDSKVIKEKSYKIILHNDNVTPEILVFMVLETVFELNYAEVIIKIMEAEITGLTQVGSGYSFSQASEKISQADELCKIAGFKLKLTIEEE